MTRKEANEFDMQLKGVIRNSAYKTDLDNIVGEYIVDNFVEFTPDDLVMGMIFGSTPVSYKLGNVRLDLKSALLAGVEFCASINKPEDYIEFIQLLIVTAFFIGRVTKQELSRVEAYIVYWLHSKKVYQRDSGIDEDQLVEEVEKLYGKKEGKKPEHKQVIEAINHLYKLKVIEIDHSNIYLKEKVYGKM